MRPLGQGVTAARSHLTQGQLKVRLLRSVLFQISGDGETNWIEGVQLLSVYLILGILFFYLPSRTSVRTRRIRSRF
jgi:hypothetical protein